jgi:hypothetical protein
MVPAFFVLGILTWIGAVSGGLIWQRHHPR